MHEFAVWAPKPERVCVVCGRPECNWRCSVLVRGSFAGRHSQGSSLLRGAVYQPRQALALTLYVFLQDTLQDR